MWLGSQSPRRPILQWPTTDKLVLLIVCLLIAIISSYKLLAVPDLKPGDIAPYNETAPEDALVIDKQAINEKRIVLEGDFVQVIDKKQSENLKKLIIRNINDLSLIDNKYGEYKGKLKLTNSEKEWLIEASESERKTLEKEIKEATNKMLSQGIIKTLAIDQLNEAALQQLTNPEEKDTPKRSIGSKLIANAFHRKTNLKIDAIKTAQRLEELIRKENNQKISVKKGEIITVKGVPITPQAFDILDHFNKVSRSPRSLKWLLTFTESLGSCGLLLLIMRREQPRLKAKHGLLSLALLLIVQITKDWIGMTASPLQLILPPTLLLSQGIGTISSLAWMAIASLNWPTQLMGISSEGRILIAAIAGSFVALLGRRMRSRAQVLQIALLIPFGTLILQWFIFNNRIEGEDITLNRLFVDSNSLLKETLILSAMLMITILIIPILENTFGLLTRARLMELADQQRPLLRRLSREAPGTFEHTLTIVSLAEEGARVIGVDIDLIRTGALYHDVGKLHSPNWFIENQQDGINPHEEIKDPYKSADILQAHVDEGLKLAKKYRLPTPIADFIPEHQGTLKMSYFLHKAKENDPSVSEKRFRYKGPIPRSKETGILMLADGCEAALRSLDASTSNHEASGTVRKIIQSRQLDGQLKESSLSRAEIELIIRAFVRVWRRMRHRRLKYPSFNSR